MQYFLRILLLIIVSFVWDNGSAQDSRSELRIEGFARFHAARIPRLKEEVKRQRLEIAKSCFNRIVKEFPGHQDHLLERLYLALIEEKLGNYRQAKKHLQHIISSPFAVYLDVIFDYFEQGRLWFLLKKLFLYANNCQSSTDFLQVFNWKDFEHFYSRWPSRFYPGPLHGGTICFLYVYSHQEIRSDLSRIHFCRGDVEESLRLLLGGAELHLTSSNTRVAHMDQILELVYHQYPVQDIHTKMDEFVHDIYFEEGTWFLPFFQARIRLVVESGGNTMEETREEVKRLVLFTDFYKALNQ